MEFAGRQRRLRFSGSATIEQGYLLHSQYIVSGYQRSSDGMNTSFEAGFDRRRYTELNSTTTLPPRISAQIGQLTTNTPVRTYLNRIGFNIMGSGWSIDLGEPFVDPVPGLGDSSPPPVGGRYFRETFSWEIYFDLQEVLRPLDGALGTVGVEPLSEAGQLWNTEVVPGLQLFTERLRVGGVIGGRVVHRGVTYAREITITNTNRGQYEEHIYAPYVAAQGFTISRHSGRTAGVPDAPNAFPTAEASWSATLDTGGGTISGPGWSATAVGGSTAGDGRLRLIAKQLTSSIPVSTFTLYTGEWYAGGNMLQLYHQRETRLTATLLDGNGQGAGPPPGMPWGITFQNVSGTAVDIVTKNGAAVEHTLSLDAREITAYIFEGNISWQGFARLGWSYPRGFPSLPDAYSAKITNASWNAAGLNVLGYGQRLTLRGRRWPIKKRGHLERVWYGFADPTDEGSGWDVDTVTEQLGVTASVVSGKLRLETSAGFAGGLAAQLESNAPVAEYRHHRVRWRRVDATTGEMRIERGTLLVTGTPAVWRFPAAGTAGTWQEESKDLFAPDNPTPALPDASLGGTAPDIAVTQQEWNIYLPAGAGTWELEHFIGERKSFAFWTLMKLPLLEGIMDGCVDGMSLIALNGSAVRNYSYPAAVDKPWAGQQPWGSAEWLNNIILWPMDYWTDGDNTVWEGGHGVYRDGGGFRLAARITMEAEDDSADDPQVDAQEVLDSVRIYPWAGDVFGGSYGLTERFDFVQIVSPRTVALVTGEEVALPRVRIYDEGDNPIAEGGEPGEEGWCEVPGTILRYQDYTARLDPESDPADRLTISEKNPRDMVYTFWVVAEEGVGISSSVSPTQRVALAYTLSGEIVLAYGDQRAILDDTEVESAAGWLKRFTGLEGTRPAICYSPLTARLTLVYEGAGDSVVRGLVEDEESVGSTMTLFTPGSGEAYSFPALAISQTGMEHHFAVFAPSGGGARQIRGKVLDAQGNEAIAEFTAVAGSGAGVADDQISCEVRGGVIVLMYRDNSGLLKAVRSTNGTTFA